MGAFTNSLSEDRTPSKEQFEMANVWRRFISYFIDNIVLLIIDVAIVIPAYYLGIPTVGVLIVLVCFAGYFTYFFGKGGQTIGMMAMGIRLIGTDGITPIGYKRGFLRFVGMILSGWILYLGFFWILIDKNRQGWHDTLADTYVIMADTIYSA